MANAHREPTRLVYYMHCNKVALEPFKMLLASSVSAQTSLDAAFRGAVTHLDVPKTYAYTGVTHHSDTRRPQKGGIFLDTFKKPGSGNLRSSRHMRGVDVSISSYLLERKGLESWGARHSLDITSPRNSKTKLGCHSPILQTPNPSPPERHDISTSGSLMC